VTLDLLGHGASDRPTDMWRYSMTEFGREVVALLDHLDAEDAVVMGTSLGANATLEVASLAPERLRGMVIEMPVLDNALLGSAVAFTPLMLGLTFGAPAARALARAARRVPSGRLPWQAGILVDWVAQDPEPSAAVIQGLFFGRTAPHRSERRTFEMPALVIGHRHDIIHPFSDAGMLADELPNGRLLQANSIVELRLAPERLTNEIAAFLDECWKPRATRRRRAAS
jgi:pimeloyl-ACP methyl ester carboxylesterase